MKNYLAKVLLALFLLLTFSFTSNTPKTYAQQCSAGTYSVYYDYAPNTAGEGFPCLADPCSRPYFNNNCGLANNPSAGQRSGNDCCVNFLRDSTNALFQQCLNTTAICSTTGETLNPDQTQVRQNYCTSHPNPNGTIGYWGFQCYTPAATPTPVPPTPTPTTAPTPTPTPTPPPIT